MAACLQGDEVMDGGEAAGEVEEQLDLQVGVGEVDI